MQENDAMDGDTDGGDTKGNLDYFTGNWKKMQIQSWSIRCKPNFTD